MKRGLALAAVLAVLIVWVRSLVPWWSTLGCLLFVALLAAAVVLTHAPPAARPMSAADVDQHLADQAAKERAVMAEQPAPAPEPVQAPVVLAPVEQRSA